MKIISLALVLFLSSINAQIKFDDYFQNKTLRFDFFHTGDRNSELISFTKMIEEGEWSGSRNFLLDPFSYGNYMLEVIDESSGKLIFSRGFSTLYQEWQTTEESKNIKRSFSGSVLLPFPKNMIKLIIQRRDRKNIFQNIYEKTINPDDYFIIKEKINPFNSFKVHYSGESSNKLDIVFIPEGYTIEEMNKFKDDCKRFTNYLFDYSPFKENREKINTWGIEAPSTQSGTDIPAQNIWKQTIINSHFYTFNSERYLMTEDYSLVRDIASNAPYDQIFILVNTPKYGGGAIYNYYSMTSAYDKRANQIFVHEFAHGLAGLADEYGNDNTYQDMYPLDVEPWESNLTTLVNFEGKWKNQIDKGTPIPTPEEDRYKNSIGVFEGGGYVKRGVYRPTFNSIMNSFTSNEFNAVCKKVIEQMIKYYSE
jgi:hypothetical protein